MGQGPCLNNSNPGPVLGPRPNGMGRPYRLHSGRGQSKSESDGNRGRAVDKVGKVWRSSGRGLTVQYVAFNRSGYCLFSVFGSALLVMSGTFVGPGCGTSRREGKPPLP